MQTNRKKSFFSTERLVLLALLVALQVVMGKIIQINLVSKEFNLGFLPIAAAGALMGPAAGAVVGALGDLIGSLLFPTGAYFPGFTLTSALVGAAYGLALYHRKPSWVRAIAAAASGAVINLMLNSLWLSMLYGSKTYWGWVAARAATYPVEAAVQAVIMMLAVTALSRVKLPGAIRLYGKDMK